jgi:hypothetical protein
VDLEDKLLYGLTPTRLAYLLIALVAAFALWSSHWAPAIVRISAAAILATVGAASAWGRWHGRAADQWLVDIAAFATTNYRFERRTFRRKRERNLIRCPAPPMDLNEAA